MAMLMYHGHMNGYLDIGKFEFIEIDGEVIATCNGTAYARVEIETDFDTTVDLILSEVKEIY